MPIIPTGFSTPDGSIKLEDGGSVVGVASALEVKDEGGSLDANVNTIDFKGAGVTAVENGDHNIEVTIAGAAGTALEVKDEGGSLDADVTTINFTGAGVTAVENGDHIIDVDIAGSTGTALEIKEEGASLDVAVDTIDFKGDCITAIENGDHNIEVTVAAGLPPIYATVSDESITADYENDNPFISLQAAITALEADSPNGGTIYVHAGVYEFASNAPITISQPNIHIIGAGRETVIKKDTAGGSHNSAIFDINADGCSIQNMTLDCNASTRLNPMLDLDTIDSYKGLLVRNVTFTGMNNSSQVCFYKGLGIEVDNCRFESASADAVIWYAPEGSCEIKNSIIMNSTVDMTYLIVSDASIDRFKFINNLVYGNGLTIDLGATGGDGNDSEHWEISNNFIFPEADTPNGIYIDDSNTTGANLIDSIISNNIIEMTTTDATGTYGMKLSNIDNCSIIGNKVKITSTVGTGETYGILAYSSNISNNEVYVDANTTGDTVYGIGSVGDSLKSKIDNNIIYVDGADTALYGIYNTTACGSVCGNNITINSVDGSVNESGTGIDCVSKIINNNNIYIGDISAGGGAQTISGIKSQDGPINCVCSNNTIYFKEAANGAGQEIYGIFAYEECTVVNGNSIFCDCISIHNDGTSIFTGIYINANYCVASGNIINNGGAPAEASIIRGINLANKTYCTAADNIFKGGNWDDQIANVDASSNNTNSVGPA